MSPKHTNIIRWIARVWAALMVVFMLFMFIAHIVQDGIGPALNFSIRDSLMMVSLVTSVFGLALGWKWERLGGIFTLIGMVAFYLIDYSFSGSFPRGPVFLIIAFPGVLYLLSSLKRSEEVAD
ncbi:MAG: hypothetical protein MUO54_07305 [Anaerolineales bacterium]|nr:hypothetical protein [Anaerolineales bacterium]